MRWGFGRGRPGRRRADGQAGDPSRAAGGAQPPESAAPQAAPPVGAQPQNTEQLGREQRGPQRRGLEWRRLPPLRPTVAARPILVAGPLLKLPDVTGTRPLIHRPAAAPAADVAPGRVGGVVVPRVAEPAGPAAQSATAAPQSTPQQQVVETPVVAPAEAPVIVHRRTVAPARTAPAERRMLVSVSDESVGEPQAEVTPYASSAWLRMVQAYRPQQQQFDGGDEVAAAMAAAGLPTTPAAPPSRPPAPGELTPDQLGFSRSEDGGTLSWSSSAVMAPPHLPRPPGGRPAEPSEPGAERPRRASLAESRRLGIGRPLPKGRPPAERGEQPPEGGSAADRDARPAPPRSGPTPDRPQRDADTAPAGPSRPAAPEGSGPAPAPERAETRQSPERPAAPRRLGLGAPLTEPPARRPRPPAAQRNPQRTTPQAPLFRQPTTPAAPEHAADRPEQRDPQGTATPQVPLLHAPTARTVPELADLPEQPEPAEPTALVAPTESATPSAPSDQEAQIPARPVVTAPVYSASFRSSPIPRATVAESVRPEVGELIHRSAPAPGQAAEEPRPVAPQPAPPVQDRPEPAPAPPPAPPQPVAEPPSYAPQDLVDTLRRVHGMDISDVPINRGPETAGEARSLDARAFTRDGEVFLPPGQGPFERTDTRALLAHELTHAAQQRAFGPSLPSEDSPAGRALEAQALAAERSVQTPGALPRGAGGFGSAEHGYAPLTHFPAPAVFSAPTPQPAAAGRVQRAPDDLFEAPSGWNLLARHDQPDQTGAGTVPPQDSQGSQSAWTPPQQSAPAADPELAAARNRLLELADQRLVDLDDSTAISELAEGIYPRIRRRLQQELLVARERTGTLSDLR